MEGEAGDEEEGSDDVFYKVEFAEDKSKRKVPEQEVFLLREMSINNSIDSLKSFEYSFYKEFLSREDLLKNYQALIKAAQGLANTLSARIEVKPHQSFVAKVVLEDPNMRYVLADEVGLGKTIEAGIIISETLRRNQKAKILIVTPGNLCAQWLAEIYSKFNGTTFKMTSLAEVSENISSENRIITSYQDLRTNYKGLIEQQWDLVVVDEVHNIIKSKKLYGLIKDLSSESKGLLLLSAVPARHRETEYQKLIQLWIQFQL